jgi:glycosyltransferase involved in cell wall biosynthesis
MKVVFFNRKPRALGNFSVESYFKQIRENLPPSIEAISLDMPFESNGIWRRLANAVYCIYHQGDINHITGDINYVAIFLKRKKTIITFLDCGNLHQSKGIKYLILKLIWYTIPVKRTIHLTAISQATKYDILNFTRYDQSKISVIYVSIKENYKPKLKIFNAKKPRILQVGTAPNKNLERLIPALNNIPCTLVIVGKISGEIKQLLSEHQLTVECIERKLTDQEILEQYEQCDILSMVSTVEGFGMPIIEANAVGRAVVTSNTTSMPEIANNAAIIVNPWDINSIQDGFIKVIQDPDLRNQVIENGFKNQKRFQPKQLAQEYVDLYKKILAPN